MIYDNLLHCSYLTFSFIYFYLFFGSIFVFYLPIILLVTSYPSKRVSQSGSNHVALFGIFYITVRQSGLLDYCSVIIHVSLVT